MLAENRLKIGREEIASNQKKQHFLMKKVLLLEEQIEVHKLQAQMYETFRQQQFDLLETKGNNQRLKLEEVREELLESQIQLQAAQKQLTLIEVQHCQLKAKSLQLQNQISEAHNSQTTYRQEIKQNQLLIQLLDRQEKELQQLLQQEEVKRKELQQLCLKYQQEEKSSSSKAYTTGQALEEIKQEIADRQRQILELQKKMNKIEKVQAELDSDLINVREEYSTKLQTQKSMSKSIQKARSQNTTTQNEIISRLEQADHKAKEIQQTRRQLDLARKESMELEDLNNEIQNDLNVTDDHIRALNIQKAQILNFLHR